MIASPALRERPLSVNFWIRRVREPVLLRERGTYRNCERIFIGLLILSKVIQGLLRGPVQVISLSERLSGAQLTANESVDFDLTIDSFGIHWNLATIRTNAIICNDKTDTCWVRLRLNYIMLLPFHSMICISLSENIAEVLVPHYMPSLLLEVVQADLVHRVRCIKKVVIIV
jgi:hypothetical protein